MTLRCSSICKLPLIASVIAFVYEPLSPPCCPPGCEAVSARAGRHSAAGQQRQRQHVGAVAVSTPPCLLRQIHIFCFPTAALCSPASAAPRPTQSVEQRRCLIVRLAPLLAVSDRWATPATPVQPPSLRRPCDQPALATLRAAAALHRIVLSLWCELGSQTSRRRCYPSAAAATAAHSASACATLSSTLLPQLARRRSSR